MRLALRLRFRFLFRAARRELAFRRAMKRFLRDPESCTHPESPVLIDLVHSWGNRDWSAWEEYLAACIGHALNAKGPILECGSGLSTVLVGAIAKKRGQNLWALEHIPACAGQVERYRRKYKLDSVVLCTTPFKDYGGYCWYDAPLDSMPDGFCLVVCDGPPSRRTKGGRYGLAPVMRDRLEPGCIILFDDAEREEDIAIARRWEAELGPLI